MKRFNTKFYAFLQKIVSNCELHIECKSESKTEYQIRVTKEIEKYSMKLFFKTDTNCSNGQRVEHQFAVALGVSLKITLIIQYNSDCEHRYCVFGAFDPTIQSYNGSGVRVRALLCGAHHK